MVIVEENDGIEGIFFKDSAASLICFWAIAIRVIGAVLLLQIKAKGTLQRLIRATTTKSTGRTTKKIRKISASGFSDRAQCWISLSGKLLSVEAVNILLDISSKPPFVKHFLRSTKELKHV